MNRLWVRFVAAIAGLVAIAIAAFVGSSTPPAAVPRVPSPAAYIYDGQCPGVATSATALERGPPVRDNNPAIAHHAVDDPPRGAPARLDGTTTSAIAPHTLNGMLARPVTGTTTTGGHAEVVYGELSHVPGLCVAAKTGTEIRKVGDVLETVDDVMANPQLLKGRHPALVENILKDTPGWQVETLGRGSAQGRGWVFRQYTDAGNPTGLQLRWHPGGGHHGPDPYWRVVGPNGDLGGIIR